MESFEEAKVKRAKLESEVAAAGEALCERFPRHGPLGLVPEHVRLSPSYRAARKRYDVAFAALREFNATFTKTFAKELRAERTARFK